MPQATQIVPKYLHSHVETYINDYTKFDDSASTPVDNNNKFICEIGRASCRESV